MKHALYSLIAMLVLVACLVADARAQFGRRGGGFGRMAAATAQFGLRSGYDFDDEAWMLGGQGRVPLIRRLQLLLSGDVCFTDDTSWQLNVDFTSPSPFLYMGCGLAVIHRHFDKREAETRTGPNLFIGTQIPTRHWLRPYLEARWTLQEDETLFRLVFGVNLVPGRRPARSR